MTEPHKCANRYPKYQTAYRVKNWPEYDQALRDRSDITLWVSQEAIETLTAAKTGKCGGQQVYSDMAIQTALALRLLFHLLLRQTEGCPRSVLTLMDLVLLCPDHTTLSRRHATVEINQQVDHALPGPISLIVDSSGLKVCGQGEWHTKDLGSSFIAYSYLEIAEFFGLHFITIGKIVRAATAVNRNAMKLDLT